MKFLSWWGGMTKVAMQGRQLEHLLLQAGGLEPNTDLLPRKSLSDLLGDDPSEPKSSRRSRARTKPHTRQRKEKSIKSCMSSSTEQWRSSYLIWKERKTRTGEEVLLRRSSMLGNKVLKRKKPFLISSSFFAFFAIFLFLRTLSCRRGG